MASSKSRNITLTLPGVTNYDKLRQLADGKQKFNKFNPFLSQIVSDKAKNSSEAESLDARFLDEEIYNELLMMNGLRQNQRSGKNTSYYGLSRKAKRMQLLRLSIHDIIEEVLTKLTDEIVVNSQNKQTISLNVDKAVLDKHKIDEALIKEVTEYASTEFDRIIKMYGFNQFGSENSLWNKVFLFLIEGTQAYELVWDNIEKPQKLIAIHEIDAEETEDFYYQSVKLWKHHKTLGRKEDYVILYDTQIVKIDWSTGSPNNRLSYLEHLIKSFNDLRVMDESTLIWTVTNSVFRMLVKVPTKGKSRIAAAQTLATEKHRYNDDIEYDSSTGSLTVNGKANLPMMKTFFMAEGDSGVPEVTTVGTDGPDLNDMGRNEYFQRRFYKAAKIPYSRFDANSAESWNIDTRSMLREEITFGRFIQRIRDVIQMLMLKPLYLQLAARYPELRNDDDILQAFTLRFNSYSVFEELMHLDVLQEKIEAIQKINDSFVLNTPDGNDMKFFSLEFLINEYLPEITSDKLKLNEKMLGDERKRMFMYQIAMAKLNAKYDPLLNLDPETGKVDADVITNAEDALGTTDDVDMLKYTEDEDEDEEDETPSDIAERLITESEKFVNTNYNNPIHD